MTRTKNKNGFSLIEILIGIGIFAVIFVGVSYLMIDNLQASFDNQEKIKADFLVAEGLEAVKAIAGNDWDQVKPGTYGLKLENNQWQLVAEPEKVDQMAKNGQRIITISEVADENLKKVESAVVWQSMTDKIKTSSAVTLLTNWRGFVSLCSDGLDNDGDGFADWPEDPGCSTAADEDEYNSPSSQDIFQCADGNDNDADGNADYPNDPGCSSAADNDETNPEILPQCSDGGDNDSDGNADYPNDPGCSSAVDNDETDPLNQTQCSDGLDNDGDGKIDYPQDPNCDSAEDDNESQIIILPVCSDGKDNDSDGKIDYPEDSGCNSALDDDESDSANPPEEDDFYCSDGKDNDGDGQIDYPDDPGCDGTTDNDEADQIDDPGEVNPVCGNGTIDPSEECDKSAIPSGCLQKNEFCRDNCQCKVPICHFTASETNPYNMLWVSYDSVDGEGNNDHTQHQGDIIPIWDVNQDGEYNDDDCYASFNSDNQSVLANVIFDSEDTPLCKLERGNNTVTGKVVLAEGKNARLQLSYFVAWPETKRTEIVYVNKGLVNNGDRFSLLTPWPGVAKNDTMVETHVSAVLLDSITGNPIMTNGATLNYYWYPWVCPAPKPQCSDSIDNDNDGDSDFPADLSCLSAEDDNEGTNNCGTAAANSYDYSCHVDDEDAGVEVKIKNNNNRGLSNAVISLPAGITPLLPKAGETYQGLAGTYSVEITNNPFYSIKFNTIGDDGYKNGTEELFKLIFSVEDYDKIESLTAQSKAALIIGEVIFTVK